MSASQQPQQTRPRRTQKQTASSRSKRTREYDDVALGEDAPPPPPQKQAMTATALEEESPPPPTSSAEPVLTDFTPLNTAVDAAAPSPDPFAMLTDNTTMTGVLFGAPSTQTTIGHDPRNPREVYSQPGAARVIDTEELVRRQISLLAPGARQGQRFLADGSPADAQFVLYGLSQEAANPKFVEKATMRKGLDTLRKYIITQRNVFDRLFYNVAPMNPDLLRAFDAERIAYMNGFAPPKALALIVPDEVRAERTGYYRKALSDVANNLLATYLDGASTGTRHLAPLLVNYHARPIVLRRLEQLRRGDYSDMPITRELLKRYFVEYVTAAYNRLVSLATREASDAPNLELSAMIAADDPFVGDDLTSLGRAFTSTYEAAPILVHYASVLALHASRMYTSYFDEWKAAQKFSAAVEADPIHKSVIAKLEEFIKSMIRTYDTYQSQTVGTAYFHANRPLSIDDYKEYYRRLLFLEIAQHRADNLYSKQRLIDTLLEYFSARDGVVFDQAILLDAPLQFPQILAEARRVTLESVADDDAVQRAVIDTRYDAAIAALRQLWPGYPDDPRSQHGPLDLPTAQTVTIESNNNNVPARTVVDKFSPYDLSYPLDIAQTEIAKSTIDAELAPLRLAFDPIVVTADANRRRDALGSLYINRVLAKELSEAEYLLRRVLSEKIEVPLVVNRMVYDSSELALEVHFELVAQLAARIDYVPETERATVGLDSEAKQALEKLQSTEFTIEWYHRPLHVPTERLIATTKLRSGTNMARIVLVGAGSSTETAGSIIEIAGTYRAVAIEAGSGKRYDSKFAATVNVYAECVRDGKRFTPTFGTAVATQAIRSHGQCVWSPIAPNDAYMDRMLALKTLVTRGVDEYNKYVRAPRDSVDTAGEPCEPPWGSSSPQHLRQLALKSDADIDALFTAPHVLGLFIVRFAANTRRLSASVVPSNDLQAFVQTVQLYTRSYSATNDVADVVAQARSLDETANKSIFALRDAAILLQKMQPTQLSELQTSALEFGTAVRDAPFGPLIHLLRSPFASIFQTGRERRYVRKLHGDYETFVRLYKCKRAAAHNIVLETSAPNYSAEAVKYMLDRFNPHVESLRIDEIYRATIDDEFQMRDLFIDVASRCELRSKIEGLPRSVKQIAQQQNIEVASLGDSITTETWRGNHSFASPYPDLLVVSQSYGQVPSTGLPRSLIIVQRGSEPLNHGYDFAALFAAVEYSVNQYNASARTNAPSEDWYYEAGRQVTIYNYFAFLAPSQPTGSFVDEPTLRQRIINGVYQHVAQFVPTPFEEIK